MSRSKTPTISHRLEYLVYRGLEWGIQMMSLETTFKVGEFAGRFSHRILKTRRRQVIRNLTFAFLARVSASDSWLSRVVSSLGG